MRKRFLMTGFLAAAGLLAGCGGSAGNSSLGKISRLQEENRLETQTERLEAENQQLLEQCSASTPLIERFA